MAARLVSWLRALLRALASWLDRLGQEPAGGEMTPGYFSPSAPEHWLRKASTPPPAHWLAVARRARPLDEILDDPACPAPESPGAPQPRISAPPRRRGEPVLSAPKRAFSPNVPSAGKDGPFPPPLSETAAPPERKRLRVFTRVEDVPAPARKAVDPAPPPPARPSPELRPDALERPRRRFEIREEVSPRAPAVVTDRAPELPLSPKPEPALRPEPPPLRFAEREDVEPLRAPRLAIEEPRPPELSRDVVRTPFPEPPVRSATKETVPFVAADRWPELEPRRPENDEPWRAASREAERRRRLDLEQRGDLWSA